MPEERLKIYSDLFEEVIERDRVFGSLLRKIKTAYDMLLVGRVDKPMVPPMPDMGVGQWAHEHSGIARGAYGGVRSTEPTSRPEDASQAWEVQRENNMLKDLVERLHLELEETVRRENRWRHKATKLKARAESAAAQVPPGRQRALSGQPHYAPAPPAPAAGPGMAQGAPVMQTPVATVGMGGSGAGGVHGAPAQMVPRAYVHADGFDEAWQHHRQPDGGAVAANSAVAAAHTAAMAAAAAAHSHGGGSCGSSSSVVGSQLAGVCHGNASGSSVAVQKTPPQGSVQGHVHHSAAPGGSSVAAGHAGQHAASRSFHASRREPTGAEFDAGPDAGLNQAGLLSISSISPQTSPPPPQQPESPGALDTGRSTDSGMLPQRPDRRQVIRPSSVPPLDLARLKQWEEEEEEAENEAYLHQQGLERELIDDASFQGQEDIQEYVQALEQHLIDCEREGRYEEAEFARARLEQLRQHEELQMHFNDHRRGESLEVEFDGQGGGRSPTSGTNQFGMPDGDADSRPEGGNGGRSSAPPEM